MKNSLGAAIRHFAADLNGNTSVIFALSAIPLLVGAGAAVDTARAYRAQTYLQAATDSAALAAGGSHNITDEQVASLVENYLASSGAAGSVSRILSADTKIDGNSGTVSVTVHAQMKTSLMNFVGISTADIFASSEVNIGSQSIEVALVLDNTGSMNSQNKLGDLKNAAKLMIQSLVDNKSSYSSVKFGLVPFSLYVNVGLSNRNASWMNVPADTGMAWWKGCVGSRTNPLDTNITLGLEGYTGILQDNGFDGSCSAEITPLTSDVSKLNSEIDQMVAVGRTYIPGGVLWGWNVLDSGTPYTEAMTKPQRMRAHGKRALVLMTDGSNTAIPDYLTHKHVAVDASEPGRSGQIAQANALTSQVCEAVKADGIDVFTVAFKVDQDVTVTPAQIQATKDMLTSCASSPDNAFDVDNGEALKTAFRNIAMQLASLHLSK